MKKLLIIFVLIFSLQVLADDKYKTVFIPIVIQLLDNEREIVHNYADIVVFDNRKECRNHILDYQEDKTFSNTAFKKFVSGTDGLVSSTRGLSTYVICQRVSLHKKTLGIRK